MYSTNKKVHKSDKQRDTEKCNIKELCAKVTGKICYPEGVSLLSDSLSKFSTSNSESHQSERQLLIEAVLMSLLKTKVTTNHVDSIINRIVMEFPNCGKKTLLHLVEFCLDRIQNNDDDHMCWKDLLPPLLQKLRDEKFINFKGSEIPGVEYKSIIVRTIGQAKWDLNLLTSLAKMFREMALEKADLDLVSRSLCDALFTSELSEIPPLIHQLLRLNDDSRLLLNTLQKYFSHKYDEASQQSDVDFDSIGPVEKRNVKETESTVLYHIYQAVQMDQKILKVYLRFLRNVTNKPEFIMDSFIISVLLFNVDFFRDQVFEVLKLSIIRKCHEEERCKNSLWLRNLVPNEWKVIDVFGEVIDRSKDERSNILSNLLEFAFYLMATEKKIGHDDTAILWEVGTKVVQRIAKKEHDSGSNILMCLSERIMTNENSFLQYTDCLAYMCRRLTLVTTNNQSLITSLLEQLLSKAGSDVMPVVSAVLPLLKTSQRVRDTFVLVLRKALTKSDIYLRKMSVLGFLELLKNLKVSSLNALSQGSANCSSSTSSASSHFTQATFERNQPRVTQDPKYNMSLCQELLSILKRCLMYDCQVRLYLYQGVYDAVVVNMELAEYVSEMLLDHFKLFWEPSENILPPIVFDKCTITQGAEEVLQEPLGELVFLIQKLYIKTALKNYAAVNTFSIILESLCKRISLTEAEHLNLNEATDLLDNVPKAQQSLHHLKLTISVCEALIAYKFCSWSKDSDHNAQSIKALFKTYLYFIDFLKKSNKVKKGDSKKVDKDATTDRSMIRKNTRANTLKVPNTVMDIQTVYKMLSLLYDPNLTWASKEEVDILKDRVEFNNYVLQTCLQLIRNTKALKKISIKQHKDKCSRIYMQIGRLLFKNVISNLEEVMALNSISSIYAVECFKELCDLMCNSWTSELSLFLNIAGDVDEKEGLDAQIKVIFQQLKNQFDVSLQVDVEEDANLKKVPLHLIETISYFVHKMTFERSAASNDVQEWLKNQAATEINDSSISLIVIQLMLFVDARKIEFGEMFLSNICSDLSDKFSEDNQSDTGEYAIINVTNFVQVACAVNKALNCKLLDVVSLFNRLKAEQVLICTPGFENNERREKLRDNEIQVCSQLASIVGNLDTLASIKRTHGLHSDALLKNVHQVFNILCNLTKYITSKCKPGNATAVSHKFQMLIKSAGKDLKPSIESYIYKLEEDKKPQGKSSDSKIRRNKILKETKLIPRVIHEIEQFHKDILILSKKSGIELNKNIKQSHTRDFAISKKALVENLDRIDASLLTTQNTTHHTTRNERDDDDNDETNVDSDSDRETSQSKRRRLNSSTEE